MQGVGCDVFILWNIGIKDNENLSIQTQNWNTYAVFTSNDIVGVTYPWYSSKTMSKGGYSPLLAMALHIR